MVPIIQNYIDMLVSIPLKMSVLGFMKYLTGESAQMIFQKRGNMKYAYRNCEFFQCKGNYVNTIDKNRKAIQNYKLDQ